MLLSSYQKRLKAEGRDVDALYRCPRCGEPRPAASLCDVRKLVSITEGFKVICGVCYDIIKHDYHPFGVAKDPDEWTGESEARNGIVIDRDNRIASVRWTQIPTENFMLTLKSIAAQAGYIKKLSNLSVDYAKPSLVVWPSQPKLEYRDT